jgi:heptaprenyl diphosphate synthase
MKVSKLVELSLLATIALTIFIIELRIPNPIPIPGIKLGLANIVAIYAVYRYRPKEVFMLVLTRTILGAFFSGQIISLAYSLAGGLLCLVGVMLLRWIIPEKNIWICSILGAVLHNIGQIVVAILITGTLAIIAYLPLLIVSGCIAGTFTGLCAQLIINRGWKRKYADES